MSRPGAPVGAPSVCFARRAAPVCPPAAIDTHRLPQAAAAALADVLPFLRCGEESAIHAFGRRLARCGDAVEAHALAAITADECRHADWLAALAAALPAPRHAPPPALLAPFFRRLLSRDKALHFARIAALDLAVCALLRPLVARGSVLAAAPQVVAGFQSIRQDEARHVRVARDCAARLGWPADGAPAFDRAMHRALAGLMAPVQRSLAQLGITGFDAARGRGRAMVGVGVGVGVTPPA